jgi:hypothetical protein
MKAKHIASKAQENIITILDDTPEKKDMIALNAISGTHIDKYRLLSDKSTQNISMADLDVSIEETARLIRESEERLKKLTGGAEMGNKPEIIDVDGECTP